MDELIKKDKLFICNEETGKIKIVDDIPLSFTFVNFQKEVRYIRDVLGIIDEDNNYSSLFIKQNVETGDIISVWGCEGTIPYSNKPVTLSYPLENGYK